MRRFALLLNLNARPTSTETMPAALQKLIATRYAGRDLPVAVVLPDGARPFWDLLRQKVALLPS